MTSASSVIHLVPATPVRGGVETYIERLTAKHDIADEYLRVALTTAGEERAAHYENYDLVTNEPTDLKELVESRPEAIVHQHADLGRFESSLDHTRSRIVRSVHDNSLACPSGTKFFRFKDRQCHVDAGAICALNAYLNGCANRSPLRLGRDISSWSRSTKLLPEYASVVVYSGYMEAQVRRVAHLKSVNVLPYFTDPLEPVPDQPNGPIVCVGRLNVTKGFHRLVDAVAPILLAEPTRSLELVGGGSIYAELSESLARLPLASRERVHIQGPLDSAAVAQKMASAAIVVVPSLYPEAFGIVGIEAMMSQKAVVASDVGGISDWLHHERTGFLVSPDNTAEMGARIQQLLANGALRRQLGQEARAIAQQKFIRLRHVDSLSNIYAESRRGLV